MPDALGWRCKFAVVAPSTNTIVQPDMEAFRPEGVTNHFGRIYVPNMPVHNDDDFVALVEAIGATLNDAVERCMTCAPDYLIMGMSALMFWDGRAASERRMEELADFAGVRVSAGSFACEAALNLTGAKRIAVISPYQPVSDREVTRFFQDCGFEVRKFHGLRCDSPVAIAQVQPETLGGHLRALDDDSIDAWVQVGTNLSMVALGREVEAELGKPVITINSATYWHALRAMGIDDQFDGHGWLFKDH
ncbi:arylmalonate decarboxylase [Thalassococcus sp. S3]|uniref:maleate cis-trans isomerase family protein n=1 Tax=Thalassococcus sp. S3 TaxID=2017482 RepID=UPI0010248BBC|nr:arylmalonate decarboxylase [Thalassococcus sp. S3]QBF31998.1 arylmalonate decarboxylase [Thalassococcus sp. S3]